MIPHQTSHYKALDSLGDKLVRAGLITSEQLAVARVSKEDLGVDLAEILIQKKFVTEKEILQFLSRELNVPYLSLADTELDLELVKNIPISLAKRYTLFPVSKQDGSLVVAMSNPLDLAAKDDLRAILHCEIEPVLSSKEDILEAISRYYAVENNLKTEHHIERAAHELEVIGSPEEEPLETSSERLQEIASGPKVITVVNQILSRAYSEKASDVHIEPYRDLVRIRYRVDGFLEERETLSRQMLLPIISRIKIMAGLDIAERRIPQDGRIRINLLGNCLDLRISTYPTMKGEKVAIRLLCKENLINIEDLGFRENERKLFADLVGRSYGLFLVTGPTGSGKSTTLYSGLMRINAPDKNIVSIEDPVESEVPGINQAQINPKAGITFATALRAILRQDPNVVMVGEIRDAETADIAVRAAMTGHMVLSTLHTNTASGVVSRLLDLGVESFLLSSALIGILNQRLVRKICPHCKEEVAVDKSHLGASARIIKKMFRGKGCQNCRMTGYQGRVGIFELAPVEATIRELIYRKASDVMIREQFRKMGVKDIREDGFEKVNAGLTTLDEVMRVTEETDERL